MTNTVETSTGSAIVSIDKNGHYQVCGSKFKVHLVIRPFPSGRDSRSYWAKVRAYGVLDAFVPGFSDRETELVREANDRNPDVKDPVLAAFQRRSINDAKEYMQHNGVLATIAEALRECGIEIVLPQFDEWKFSIKAGCSMCPCSPGFIGQDRMLFNGRPVDLFFD